MIPVLGTALLLAFSAPAVAGHEVNTDQCLPLVPGAAQYLYCFRDRSPTGDSALVAQALKAALIRKQLAAPAQTCASLPGLGRTRPLYGQPLSQPQEFGVRIRHAPQPPTCDAEPAFPR